jgi:hypothetical protein
MQNRSLQESALPDVGWPEERLASLKSEFKNQLVGTLHRTGALSGEVIIMVVNGVET